MGQSAYIELVQGSDHDSITLDDVVQVLERYRSQTALTGQQLDWNYAEMAFPYEIETRRDGEHEWLYLRGKHADYRAIFIGIGTKQEMEPEQAIAYIQVVLPDGATHGDKAKANELCRYIGRRLKAQVTMFNGRTMYFNTRK
ncbi:hypothetical protein PRECH8_08510 [Insulibacter thermoxylanivorax]|uniref:DUF1885 family protein n=1 Tax=Insulibacter thermoxylanivorax TaxID=2749268 RepID=A0A916QB83_9BACL|nr:DUF1885 family protein [Insulibacter thermoxylanivorax]GFR37555.1 hypothetical protein PRECH8_08510 [Insulibacter thermoxylanivorax]